MSKTTLALWLSEHIECEKCPQKKKCDTAMYNCSELLLEWLEEELNEDD